MKNLEKIRFVVKGLLEKIFVGEKEFSMSYKDRQFFRNPQIGTPRKCLWNGVVYRSMAEAARKEGFNYSTFKNYIYKGYTKDNDIRDLN